MNNKLMDFFNKQPRLGLLSTSDKTGKSNAAYFGTPRMVDPETVVIGLGKNRTLTNLEQNPQAVFTIMEPGPTVSEWKGVRLYMNMTDIQTCGEALNAIKQEVAEVAGKETANMLHAVTTFKINEIRPLADFGQGWEQAI